MAQNTGIRYTGIAISTHNVWKKLCFIFIAEIQAESDEIGNVIEEVVDLVRKLNLELDSDNVQELLDFHNLELAMDELIEMHELSSTCICPSKRQRYHIFSYKIYLLLRNVSSHTFVNSKTHFFIQGVAEFVRQIQSGGNQQHAND
ncbi:hypothetical protein TNCV_376971 [Trichonephila clavipes]|nr:hypothetical protein TNCV_376971 [Trichonephila clavipes]